MSNAYESCKQLAYPILSTGASCNHDKATSMGYKDAWQMLLDKHNDDEMAVFCASLSQLLSRDQTKILLDGLAKEYTEFSNWLEFIMASSDFPDWRPSRGTIAQYKERFNDPANYKERTTDPINRKNTHTGIANNSIDNFQPLEMQTIVDEDYAKLSDLAERFIWARKRSGKTQEVIGNCCGLTEDAVLLIENKRNGIRGENIFPLADALGVNARWLLTGEGTPCSSDKASLPPKIKRIAEHLSALPDDRLNALSVVLGIKL